jgi:hypothetical protein
MTIQILHNLAITICWLAKSKAIKSFSYCIIILLKGQSPYKHCVHTCITFVVCEFYMNVQFIISMTLDSVIYFCLVDS